VNDKSLRRQRQRQIEGENSDSREIFCRRGTARNKKEIVTQIFTTGRGHRMGVENQSSEGGEMLKL